jgi:hypothetical protein
MKHLNFCLQKFRCVLGIAICFFSICFVIDTTAIAASARELRPQSDSEVIELLAPRTKAQPATLDEAIAQARIAIQSSRELQDPRYLGRARATLRPWWGKEGATEDVLVLQATIEQSLHLFAEARKTLATLQAKHPENLAAWLTQSSLDRLVGNYAAAMVACDKAAKSFDSNTAKVYGDLCSADIQCHLSNTAQSFRSLLINMNRRRLSPEVLSWGLSLLAECEERTGDSIKSLETYRSSLALAADSYTAISYADALLRNNEPEKVMQVLARLPKSDAVLLRLAHAMRLRGNGQWKMIHSDLMQRFQESAIRGDAAKLHARELAYAALWLSDAEKTIENEASVQARINIESQKEVIDWLLLFSSLDKVKDFAALKQYTLLLQKTGLRDQRLAAWIVSK